MILICPALKNGNILPERYTCRGEGVSPPLNIRDIPKDAKSLVLIMSDPDAPLKTFIHWILYDIPASIEEIEENEQRFKRGRNSLFRKGYFPPCPPCGMHRYIFEIYAIDKFLDLKEGASIRKVKKEMRGHVIEKTELVTLFGKR